MNSCTHLFYHPDRYLYAHPKNLKIEFEEIWFKGEDGVDLNAWYLKNSEGLKKPKGLFVFFHGNAQNLSAHFLALAWLTKHGYDIFIPDYRGYGLSDGEPSQEALYKDSLIMLKEGWKLFERDHHQKLIIYGQSLGGAIAARAFNEFPHHEQVDLLVLDSTFMSYKNVAWSVAINNWITLPLSPFVWVFVSDKYSSKEFVPKIKTPTLVIHSEDDQIIPFKHGKLIYQALTGEKKWFWQLKKIKHIQAFAPTEKKERTEFVKFLEKF
jgi:hypothetical protein